MPPCSPFGSVSVIDADTNTITTTKDVHPRGGNSFGVGRGFAATPDGKRLYLAGGNVSVIDTATNRIVAEINDIPAANSIAISLDGLRAYVGSGYGFIGVIDMLPPIAEPLGTF